MQTIKGLIALLVVAAVVFAIGATNNIKSQARYAARLLKPAAAANVFTAGRQAGTTTETNAVHQARHKNKNANL
jgi:hypothetical protein